MEYYQKELEIQFDKALSNANLREKKQPYSELIDIFKKHFTETDKKKSAKYEKVITKAAEAVDKLYSKTASPEELVRKLPDNVKKSVETFRKLESREQDLFLQILTAKNIPEKKAAKQPEYQEEQIEQDTIQEVVEDTASKDETIDDVLHEYFKSELNVHLDKIKQYLEENKKEPGATHITNIIAQFQALKEISMIHGYNGIEHFCSSLISTLKKAKDEKRYIGNESYSIFEGIFADMQKIERYQTGSNVPEEDQKAQIDEFGHALYESMTTSKPKKEETAKEEDIQVEVPEEPAEELISFTDKDKIFEIIKDVYRKVHSTFTGRLQLDWVINTLDQITGGTKIALPGLEEKVGKPLREAYIRRDELKNEEKKECGNIIDKIWNELIKQINDSPDFSKLEPLFLEIKNIGAGEQFTLEEDKLISRALVESEKSKWIRIKNKLGSALNDNNDKDMIELNKFFSNFSENCQLTGYVNYLPLLDYFKDIVSRGNNVQIPEDIIDEIDKSVNLTFERIESQGISGNCDDILEAVKDLTTQPELSADLEEEPAAGEPAVLEKQTLKDETAEDEIPVDVESETEYKEKKEIAQDLQDEIEKDESSQTEIEGEEDVEKIFFTECREYLDNAQKALNGLKKDAENKKYYNDIETAMHAIRSAAHLLNKSSIGENAAIIEEAAEIFGQASYKPVLMASVHFWMMKTTTSVQRSILSVMFWIISLLMT